MAVIADATTAFAARAVEAVRALTNGGETIDDHQVAVERVAYAATEARVIAELQTVPAEVARSPIARSHRSPNEFIGMTSSSPSG